MTVTDTEPLYATIGHDKEIHVVEGAWTGPWTGEPGEFPGTALCGSNLHRRIRLEGKETRLCRECEALQEMIEDNERGN